MLVLEYIRENGSIFYDVSVEINIMQFKRLRSHEGFVSVTVVTTIGGEHCIMWKRRVTFVRRRSSVTINFKYQTQETVG